MWDSHEYATKPNRQVLLLVQVNIGICILIKFLTPISNELHPAYNQIDKLILIKCKYHMYVRDFI